MDQGYSQSNFDDASPGTYAPNGRIGLELEAEAPSMAKLCMAKGTRK